MMKIVNVSWPWFSWCRHGDQAATVLMFRQYRAPRERSGAGPCNERRSSDPSKGLAAVERVVAHVEESHHLDHPARSGQRTRRG
jgi:hypothetical protein